MLQKQAAALGGRAEQSGSEALMAPVTLFGAFMGCDTALNLSCQMLPLKRPM